MQYRIRLLLIIVGISGILLSSINRNYSGNLHAISIIIFIAQLVIIEMMLRESDIYKTIYYRLFNISMAIYFVAVLFKILDNAGADMMLLIALSSISLIYF